MRIWPVILDSQPSYLHGRGRSASLLLAPLGTSVLVQHLVSALGAITTNAPLIVANADADPSYADWMRALCPTAQVATTPAAVAEAVAGHELSDALLFVDARCMPAGGFSFAALLRHHTAEPRIAHHLVAFERGHAGTQERVSFDAGGQIRGIQRYYEQTTWPFIAGIAASLVPRACGLGTDGVVPQSLVELRHVLTSRGVPSRDVPLDGHAVDLAEERGMLAANEQLILEAAAGRDDVTEGSSAPVYVGEGHSVHATARLMGPIVVHPEASIEANATVLGPAVIGRGARISSGAVFAHGTVGPDAIVPPNVVVRDRVWFKSSVENVFGATEHPVLSYSERLARLSLDSQVRTENDHQSDVVKPRGERMKRAFDIAVALFGLTVTSPLLLLIALAVWVESRGPIFYGDKREGRKSRAFRCWKFRTMFTGAHLAQRDLKALDQTDGPHFKMDRDPRVTKVGRVLRALNLDEVPQLYNVLSGEMSLVGPRPSPFRENQVCVPWRSARLSVRPGITGLWQVCRHDRSSGDFHQWIEYDLLYVQHQSFWLDMKILLGTFCTLGGKLRHVPTSWLVGPTAVHEDSPFAEEALRAEAEAQDDAPRTQRVA